MPPGTMTVQNYCNLLLKSKLLTSEEVKDIYRRWADAKKGSADDEADSLRKYLVSRKLLTEYQSHLLMRGHSEGFFLDQYKILDLLGKGKMAGVYKAAHASGQVVSIKVLPPSKAKDPMILSRFQREGRMLTRLDHPNVVRAFQVGESSGKHFFVMEHLEGESLDEILQRRKRLSVPEAVALVHQALLGLQHVFEKGLVHRDLKPANLVLVPAPTQGANETTLGCTLRIVDIGLGRTTFDEDAHEPEEQLTSEGTLLGTPDYLAPEQARSAREADIRSDIYSIGCIFYHLLAGQVPFPGDNILGQIVKHATENARPLSEFVSDLPDGLQQVINWMMAKDPNQRYPTPARAAMALQPYLSVTAAAQSLPVARPLKAYMQYLQSTGSIDLPPEVAASLQAGTQQGGIAVGKLETEGKRKDRERKKDHSGPKPDPSGPKPALPSPMVEMGDNEEFDVEIVSPPQGPIVAPTKKGKSESEPRGLLELDRRDYIMASLGGGLVLIAILLGYGLSRLVRTTPTPTPTPIEDKQPDTTPIRTKMPDDKKQATDDKKTDPEAKKTTPDAKKTEPDPKKTEPDPKKTEPDPKKTEPDPKKTEPDPKKTEPDPKKTEPDPKKSTTDEKKPDDKKKDDKKPDDKKKDDKKPDDKKKDESKDAKKNPEEKKPDEKKKEESKDAKKNPEEKKPENK